MLQTPLAITAIKAKCFLHQETQQRLLSCDPAKIEQNIRSAVWICRLIFHIARRGDHVMCSEWSDQNSTTYVSLSTGTTDQCCRQSILVLTVKSWNDPLCGIYLLFTMRRLLFLLKINSEAQHGIIVNIFIRIIIRLDLQDWRHEVYLPCSYYDIKTRYIMDYVDCSWLLAIVMLGLNMRECYTPLLPSPTCSGSVGARLIGCQHCWLIWQIWLQISNKSPVNLLADLKP